MNFLIIKLIYDKLQVCRNTTSPRVIVTKDSMEFISDPMALTLRVIDNNHLENDE